MGLKYSLEYTEANYLKTKPQIKMKQYQIIFHPEHGYQTVSTNDLNYPDYIMSGWQVVLSGNKKYCEQQMEELQPEMEAA